MRSSDLTGGLQERGHGRFVADPSQRLGGGAAVGQRGSLEKLDQAGDRVAVAPEACDVERNLADGFVGIAQEVAYQGSRSGNCQTERASRRSCGANATRDCCGATCAAAIQESLRFPGPWRGTSIARRCTAGRGSPSNSTTAFYAMASRRSWLRAIRSAPRGSSILGAP